MTTILSFVLALILAFPVISSGQQSPSTQANAAQTQLAPCPTSPANKKPAIKVPSALQKAFDKYSPVSRDDIEKANASKSNTPCPPTAPDLKPQPLTKLPADAYVSIHCNPLTPSPQGGTRQTTLTLPDPKDFAVPRANDFLVDSVAPDTAAKTPCYLIKVDPKTGKSFIQQ